MSAKPSDYRPYHFENGRTFNPGDFAAFIQASEDMNATFLTRYLPCMLGGLLLGALFSFGVGGFVGNIAAVVCIFAGLIVGGVFNVRASKKLTDSMARLGITKADVNAAWQHVKNGTVAWSGGEDAASAQGAPAASQATPSPYAAQASQQAMPIAAVPQDVPMRAVWAAVAFALAWFVLAAVQLGFMGSLAYTRISFTCLGAAVLASGLYLVSRDDMRWRVSGAACGLVSALLLSGTQFVEFHVQAFRQDINLTRFFVDPVFTTNIGYNVLTVVLCLGAVLAFSTLRKTADAKKPLPCAGVGAGVYALARLALMWRTIGMLLTNPDPLLTQSAVPSITSILGTAALVFLSYLAVFALCAMQNAPVKLRGLGLAWAWLALVGAVASIALVVYTAIAGHSGPIQGAVYAYSLIIGLSACVGYILLLLGKRTGLYVILLGAGLLLAAQIVGALTSIGRIGWADTLLSSLLGALNPLFAYLAVRSADKAQNAAMPLPSQAAVPQQAAHFAVAPQQNAQAAAAAAPQAPAVRQYKESDNMGTRQETMGQAMAYWMGERPGLAVKPPFTLFTDFPSAIEAQIALLELPFIHRAVDSGKLICDRLMTFGYYETTENGVATGRYEALVTGNDLTLEEFTFAEEAFARHGGHLKNHEAPAASVRAQLTEGDASRVRPKETVRGNDGISIYEVHTGPDKASAMAFLRDKVVDRRLYYVVVETPEGNFGRDINGIYQE